MKTAVALLALACCSISADSVNFWDKLKISFSFPDENPPAPKPTTNRVNGGTITSTTSSLFKVQAIAGTGTNVSAMVNGQVIRKGDVFKINELRFRVLCEKISSNAVTLTPLGDTFDVQMD